MKEKWEKIRKIKKEVEEGKKAYMSPVSYLVLSLAVSGMIWIFALKRWMFWGVYIPEIDFAISQNAMFFICFFVCEILILIGVATSAIVPTITNAFVSAGIPVCLILALFTAEHDFSLTCIIVALSFLLPIFWAVWKYQRSPKEKYDIVYLYLCARIGTAVFLAVGILPWTAWNVFSEFSSEMTQVQFSTKIDVSRENEKKDFFYLDDLDQRWSSYSAEERFLAVEELVGYECGRLGIASVMLETQKKEMGLTFSTYDSDKKTMVLDIVVLRTKSFDDILSELLVTCRRKYQYEMMECMEELEKAGKDIKAMPDFSWGYQLLEMERLADEGKMEWETHYDITSADTKEWKKSEMEYLKKTFGWDVG